jgi:uncharacterized membrane protein
MQSPRHVRHLLKFLHTMGAIGLMGAIASLLVLLRGEMGAGTPKEYAALCGAMADIANLVLYPSMVATLIAGLLAIAFNRAFHNAGWAWIKLATGISVFEGSLVAIIGPIQQEAARSAAALSAPLDVVAITSYVGSLQASLWVMLAVTTANVVLGIWRPRLTNIPD